MLDGALIIEDLQKMFTDSISSSYLLEEKGFSLDAMTEQAKTICRSHCQD